MGAHGAHIVFHGQVAVRGAGTILRMFFQVLDNHLLHVERETATGAEIGKGHLVFIGQVDFNFQPLVDFRFVGNVEVVFVFDLR